MPFYAPANNAMLDLLGTLALRASLHSAYPGPTGANELAGGAPAYAPQAVTWGPAAGSALPSSSAPTFDVPAGSDVAWVGYWNVAHTVFYASAPANGNTPAPFTAEDSTDVLTCDGHGLADTTAVVVWDTSGAILPAPLVEGTIYYVRDATTDTFKLAATSGGAAINLTADGAGFVQTIISEHFNNQGQFLVSSAVLDQLR